MDIIAAIRRFFRENPRMWVVLGVAVLIGGIVIWTAYGGASIQIGKFFAAGVSGDFSFNYHTTPVAPSYECSPTQNPGTNTDANALANPTINFEVTNIHNNDPSRVLHLVVQATHSTSSSCGQHSDSEPINVSIDGNQDIAAGTTGQVISHYQTNSFNCGSVQFVGGFRFLNVGGGHDETGQGYTVQLSYGSDCSGGGGGGGGTPGTPVLTGACTNGRLPVVLNWGPVTDQTENILVRRVNGTGATNLVNEVSSPFRTFTYSDSALTAGPIFSYDVKSDPNTISNIVKATVTSGGVCTIGATTTNSPSPTPPGQFGVCPGPQGPFDVQIQQAIEGIAQQGGILDTNKSYGHASYAILPPNAPNIEAYFNALVSSLQGMGLNAKRSTSAPSQTIWVWNSGAATSEAYWVLTSSYATGVPISRAVWGGTQCPAPPPVPENNNGAVAASCTLIHPGLTSNSVDAACYQGGGGGTSTTPTPPVSSVSCAPQSQTVAPGQIAQLQASGGDGTYQWDVTGGGIVQNGGGQTIGISYQVPSTKTVRVSSGGSSASCTVVVQQAGPIASSGNGMLTVQKLALNVSRGDVTPVDRLSVVDGTVVQFVIMVKSESADMIPNVLVRDMLPPGMSYRPGSTVVQGQSVIDAITTTGIPLENLNPGESFTVRWSAIADNTGQLAAGIQQFKPSAQVSSAGATVADDVTLDIQGTGTGALGGVGGVKTGPDDAVMLALIAAVGFTLLYSGYTRSTAFRQKEAEHISRDQGPLDFRS